MNGLQLTGMAAAVGTVLLLAACGGGDGAPPPLPQLAASSGAKFSSCADLASRISYPNTIITAVSVTRTANAAMTSLINSRSGPIRDGYLTLRNRNASALGSTHSVRTWPPDKSCSATNP